MGTAFLLDLNPDAARDFNERAEQLLPLVRQIRASGQREGGFRPAIHPRAHLTEKEILGEIEVGFIDYRGRETGKIFDHGGKTFGLVEEGYKALEALAIQTQQTKGIRPYISAQCAVNTTFEWVKKRHREQTGEPFADFVLRECAALVKHREVWMPLYHVYVQSDLLVGKITFRTLTREMLDIYLERVLKNVSPEDHDKLRAGFDRTRSKFQGCATATIALLAEPLRAEEIATEEAEHSIAALRFFHAANQTPYVRCYCAMNGMENVAASSAITIHEGAIEEWREGVRCGSGTSWLLSNQEIGEIRSAGLDALSRLLGTDDRSPFESELLDAILLYSRNSLFDDPANRLVYILSAVESILLRDRNEPIGKNIGERLAFVVGRTAQERITIRDNAAQVYNLRSQFLHHGRAPQDMECLELFMHHVWRGFVALIHGMEKFRTKRDLIAALERRKME